MQCMQCKTKKLHKIGNKKKNKLEKRMVIENLGKARGKNTSQACESWATNVHY